jgi:hypothetical protein
MRLMNIRSRLAANTAIAQFAPSQSGKMGFRWEGSDVTVFAIERCDFCDREVEGANSITFVAPRNFVLESLAMSKIVEREDIVGELGCDDEGNTLCPECHAEGESNRRMLEVEGGK